MSSSQGLRNVWYIFVDQIILEIQVNIFDTFLFDQPVGKPDSKKIFIVEIVVRFIVKIPEGFPLQSAGPVFCAGVTMFSPLCTYGANKGLKVRHPKKKLQIWWKLHHLPYPPPSLMKEWKTKEWNICMFETPPLPPAKSEKFGHF